MIMEIIQNSIKCFQCKKILEKPVLLPCGESVCQEHTVGNDLNEFLCSSCGVSHPIPDGGFYIMKALENIIRTHIEKIDLGTDHNEAFKSCKRLDEILTEISALRNDPNYFINETVNTIRNEVELKREELKLKIDQEANRIVQLVDEYEEQCKHNWSTGNFLEKLRELEASIRETRTKLTEWLNEFNTIDFNDGKWKSIKQNSDRIIIDLEQQVGVLKQDLLLNRIKEFQIKPIEFSEIDINEKKLRSKILNIALKVDLMNMCQFSFESEWKLIYRGSDDGFAASKFHAKCDFKTNTLTIVKSVNGFVFGGYTESQWDQTNTYKTDPKAFLFSLINKENKAIKMPILLGKESLAIYGTSVSGARFGGGSDLLIADNANANTNSFTNLGHSFKHPNWTHGSNEAKCFLAGTYNFQVLEVEVFQKL